MMKNEDRIMSLGICMCGCLITSDGLIVDKYIQPESYDSPGLHTNQEIYQKLLDDGVELYYI